MESSARSQISDAGSLLIGTGRVAGRRFAELLEPTGLRTRHIAAMLALREGSKSQRHLAGILDINATKLVTVLNELEIDGLTVRRRDADDRRRHTVSLSELGRARLAALDVAKEKLDNALFRDFTIAQKALMTAFLERIGANLGLAATFSE